MNQSKEIKKLVMDTEGLFHIHQDYRKHILEYDIYIHMFFIYYIKFMFYVIYDMYDIFT